ncbi:AIG2-like family protein [Penicillium herquei]|nr:AIG2-like family protein [Penicillium herquei]
MASKTTQRPDRWYYFAYGSNMSLEQMAERCPSSVFIGTGRIDGYKWQINQRGVANIVECGENFVEGLVYEIDAKDKRRLDRNEGVTLGLYNAEYLLTLLSPVPPHCGIKTFHVAKELDIDNQLDPKRREHQAPPRDLRQSKLDMVEALVYVSRNYKNDGVIRSEYIKRMEKAIVDGQKMGLTTQFLNHLNRTIYQDVSPFQNRDVSRRSHGPYEKMESGDTRHGLNDIQEIRVPREQQYIERVPKTRPSYPRYERVVIDRPRYQDFHDICGKYRYADERPHRPKYDAGKQPEARELSRGRSRMSRGMDERSAEVSFTSISSRYRGESYTEQIIEYLNRSRCSSAPY